MQMARIKMQPGWERKAVQSIRPTMKKLGKDIEDDWHPHVQTGEMRDNKYSEVAADGTLEVGTHTHDGHGYWEEVGNSHRPGHPTLGPTARKRRGPYHA